MQKKRVLAFCCCLCVLFNFFKIKMQRIFSHEMSQNGWLCNFEFQSSFLKKDPVVLCSKADGSRFGQIPFVKTSMSHVDACGDWTRKMNRVGAWLRVYLSQNNAMSRGPLTDLDWSLVSVSKHLVFAVDHDNDADHPDAAADWHGQQAVEPHTAAGVDLHTHTHTHTQPVACSYVSVSLNTWHL